MPDSYAPKIPLETDENDKFLYVTDGLQNVKQKLKTILLTNPGEKIFDPEFGVGIKKYLFEPKSGVVTINGQSRAVSINSFKSDITTKLSRQVAKYSSDIIINSINIDVLDDRLELEIQYSFNEYLTDSIIISIGA